MRTTTSEVTVALASGQMPMIVLVEMDFPNGFLRCNNSSVNFTWGGHEWLGVGRLGSIDPIKEGAELEARGLSFRISGVPPEHIAIALGQPYQGRTCKVWLAPLDSDHAVLADPVLVFLGRLDTMDVELGTTATITVSAESRLADWGRPRVRRYNHEDQQIDYPGDLGFEFVPQMVEKELRWGY